MSALQLVIECEQVGVQLSNTAVRTDLIPLSVHKAWKRGHPALCAYGYTRSEAIVNLLNKFGE
jgi:hypothetical protein